MKELTLREIQNTEFELLELFDAFCRKHSLKYFLSNGTLLGAVKYNGFIPWDDDIDVLVPREDYNRLLTLFQDSERYRLHAFERHQDYRFPFAKLCDMTTRKKEGDLNNGVVLGLDIDIFPLDNWDSDIVKAKKEANYINRKMFCLNLTKLQHPDSVNPLKRAIKGILMLYCKMRGSKYFIRDIVKKSYQAEQRNSLYSGCKSWCIYGEREIIPADAFSETIDVIFEGRKFPAPAGYDIYLRSLYGDYEKDPPAEKQKSHHKFTAYCK